MKVLAQQVSPRSYTKRILDTCERLHTVDAAQGLYECDGFLLDASQCDLIACECEGFDPYLDCIHAVALGYALDNRVTPPMGEGILISLPLPNSIDAILLVKGGDAVVN